MLSPWVLRLIIANAVVYMLTLARPAFLQFLSFVPLMFFERPWTLFSYMFAHDISGFSHILFNMLGLFFFGPRLEHELGGKHFLGLYFASGLVAALVHLLVNPLSSIIGASGAVYGVMIAYALFWPRDKVYVWGVLPVEVRIMVLVMTGLSLFGGFGPVSDGIAHFAHLGGFLGGFLYIRMLKHSGSFKNIQKQLIEPLALAGDMQRWKTIQRDKLHEVNRDEFDRILAKLSTSGVAGLTDSEKSFLDRFSS